MLNYLSNRNHFVQIDSGHSNFLYSKFGVSQWQILGPVLFNLCVIDIKNCVTSCTYLQYADDSTIYWHWKAKDIRSCGNFLTNELLNMLTWSSNNSLEFSQSEGNVIHHSPNGEVVWFCCSLFQCFQYFVKTWREPKDFIKRKRFHA